MKILVLSDSHGEVEALVWAVDKVEPDMVFHLGDGWQDAQALEWEYPDLPLFQVGGNCDYRPKLETEKLMLVEGKRMLLCHGHTYGVKRGFREADDAAEAQSLDAFLFGHTHQPLVEMRGKTLFMNPGSIGLSYPPSYGVLTIEDGKLNPRIYRTLEHSRRFFSVR